MEPKIRAVTMKDVAKHVGLSQATVSYVLNGAQEQNIPEETRERVLQAIKDLGYRPNIGARQMRTQQTNLIGFVTDVIATTPYAGAVIKGAQDTARAAGKLLLFVDTEGDPEVETAAIETLLEHRVEGIVYATMYHRPVNPPATLRETKAVLLDCFVEDRSIASVTPDEETGGYEATSVLLNRGHSRVGFITNEDHVPATFGRLNGYKRALREHKIEFDPALVISAPSTPEGGYACACNMLAQANHPTAIFCYNDRMAMGAYDAIRELGLSIPRDVAVIGFDNQELISASLHPGLSTMQLPHYEMGVWAVQYLLGQGDEKGGAAPIQKILHCPFINRKSL